MYSVSYEGLEKLKSDVTRLNKKSGNNISISIISESIEKIDKVDYKFYDVDIAESRQYLGDWELIAVKKNVGTILYFPVGSNTVPDSFRNNDFSCEHCNVKRTRKQVVLIRHIKTHELKQIGVSCLKEFCGKSITDIMYRYSYISDLRKNLSSSSSCYCDISSNSKTINLKRYLDCCYASIKEFGYVNGNDARYNDTISTREDALNLYFDLPNRNNIEYIADKAIETYINSSDDSDFSKNVKTLLSSDAILVKYLGMVTFVPQFYIKSIERMKRESATNSCSKSYAVEVGEKFSGVVTYVGEASYETAFGITFIHRFVDKSVHILIWKTSKGLGSTCCEGDTVNLTGKCKANDIYRNVYQTVLTRCKVEAN